MTDTTQPTIPPHLIAVDWGTSRFRAFLLGAMGEVIATVSTEEGIGVVPAGEHAKVFEERCGPWRAANPGIAVILVGMVGSRNGWSEVPYGGLPASLDALGAFAKQLELPGGGKGIVVPGLRTAEPTRTDVMRGEEILVFGAMDRTRTGTYCLPGTHSKWVSLKRGHVERFRTFVTGELYGVVRNHAFLAKMAAPGLHLPSFDRGVEAATSAEGILSTLFVARTGVLDGSMPPSGVEEYISGVLIGSELIAARSVFQPGRVTIVASGDVARLYERAASLLRLPRRTVDATAAFITGVMRFAATTGLLSVKN